MFRKKVLSEPLDNINRLLAIFLYPLDFLIDTPILAGIIYFMESSASMLEAAGESQELTEGPSPDERRNMREKKKRAIRE